MDSNSIGIPRPANEIDRVVALAKYDILDTPSETGFDAIAQLAARLCATPISLVSLVGSARQWIKAGVGMPQGFETPRENALCATTILASDLLEISDTKLDPRFTNNPLVIGDPGIRFYAGVPLVDDEGYALGSLCVIDREPRTLTPEQRANLVLLGKATMELITARATIPRSQHARMEALATAVEFVADPIVIHEISGDGRAATITYVNVAFTTIFGYPASEIVGQRMCILFGPATDRGVTATLCAKVAANEAADVSVVMYDRDGGLHDIELHSRPVSGENGVTSNWIATLRDVTKERHNARELARQAQRTRALYTIASTQANTALAQIQAGLELGMANLGLTCGFAASVVDGILSVTTSVGTEPLCDSGSSFALAGTRFADAFVARDAVAYAVGTDYRALVVAPLTVAGEPYGLIGFAGRVKRDEGFTALDRDFVRLVAALIGSALERLAQNERLETFAFYDALTGLPNRSLFSDRLERAIAASARSGSAFALHYVDLDGFKAVNDTGGHGLGDSVLREAALRLGDSIRGGDTVARIGGDEFVLLQLNVETREDAELLATRIVHNMREPIAGAADGYSLRASVGVARYPADGKTPERLIERADAALYAAKRAGKDRVVFADADFT